MANNVYDRSFTGNQALILARRMQFESQHHHFFGQFAKFTTPDGKAVDPNKGIIPKAVKNAPVVIHRELQRNMGDEIKVPKMRLLRNLPTIGLTQMKDREERMKINHANVFIDILRHAVEPQEGIMMKHTTRDYDLAKQVNPLLLRHYSEVCNYLMAAWALYKGHSYNILESNRISGVSAYSHPHIFVAGDGKVSYATSAYPGDSGYETRVGTALNTLGTSDVFDTSLLNALSADEDIRKIQPLMTKDGTQFRIIGAHPYQLNTLKQDSNFKDVQTAAFKEAYAKENPFLTGCRFFYDGWAIFDAGNAAFPVSVSGGSPVWGPSTYTDLDAFQAYSSSTKFAAFILGDNALFKAVGQGMEYKKRMDDYDELHGVAYRTVEGYSRGDFKNLDDGTAGTAWVNEGSALICTYAAKPTV